MRRSALATALAAVLLGCSGLPAPAAARGVVHLRYGSPYPATHPFSRADLRWIEHVHAASAGRLRIDAFWAGALLSSEQNMIELRHGVADLGVITPIYARGGAHVLRAQSGFYRGARSIAAQVAVYKCLAGEFPVYGQELTGLRVLAVQGGNLPGLLTRSKPVRALRDIAGLRLRAPSELTGVLQKLGADPVSMPMGDVYAALSKGVIDGVVAPVDALRSMHLAEVGRHFTALEVPRGAYPARAISEAAWQRLPHALQRLLIESGPVWESAIEQQLHAATDRGAAFGQERGLDFIAMAKVEQQRFDALYNQGALASARELARIGVAGVPIFERAQALIGRVETGDVEPCSSPGTAARE